ncbi:MAG: type II toxin-antitoxin system HicA family toxin [Candidatus Aenigmatarchaeota archaeon]
MRKASTKDFEKFLFYIGCTFERQTDNHRIYKKDGMKRPVIVKIMRVLPEFIIKNNLRTLGISRKEFEEIMDRV